MTSADLPESAGCAAPDPVTALYVPGDRPERFNKAVASGADVVILDLEDAVAPAAKPAARSNVVAWLVARAGERSPLVQVRVNGVGTAWGADDLAALPAGVAVRLPKVESVGDVDAVGDHEVHAILESGRGVESAFEIASHPRVAAIAVGEADLTADLGITAESALAWIRTRVVVASRAAGLPPPMMSVYPDLRDLAGLAASCLGGKAMGMRGRAAIHPSQVPVISAAFAPTEAELAWAAAVLQALEIAGGGVAVLPDGGMVDAAMARRAQTLRAGA